MRLSLLLAPVLLLAPGHAWAQYDYEYEAKLDAARAEAVAAALEQDYEPSPAIWKLADHDTLIYLFGTTHALPEGFRWRSPKLNAIIDEADELVIESVEEPGSEQEIVAALIDPTAQRPPIVERVSPANRAALEAAIDRNGLTAPMLDVLPTWLAAFMFGFAELDMMGQDSAFGVETVLEAEFGAAGKPISAVEDGMAVLASIQALPEPVQRRMLEEAIGAVPSQPVDIAGGDHLWATGELDAIAAGLTPKAMGPELYAALLRNRNAAWTEWLEKRLASPGTVLFAVGAGHMVGPDALQLLLAEKGLVATRID